MEVLLVLPIFNEEKALPALLSRLAELRESGLPLRILAVDDGSTDRTRKIVAQFKGTLRIDELVHERNRGLGQTIADGLDWAAAHADPEGIVITMDADNTQPPELVPSMINEIRRGADVVIASRYRRNSDVVGLSAYRLMMSHGARALFQLCFPIKNVRDYTSGFRAYRAATLRNVVHKYGPELVQERGFACMAEVLLKFHWVGARIAEVPMVLRYDLKGGASKMNVPLTVGKLLLLVVRNRWRKSFCLSKKASVSKGKFQSLRTNWRSSVE